MSGQSLNYHIYKTLTEQNIIEWTRKCLSEVSADDVTIPHSIAESIKSLSESLAELVCNERYKHKQIESKQIESNIYNED